MTAKPGKYMWLERDYNAEDDDGSENKGVSQKRQGKQKEEEEPEPEVKAPPEVQTLVQFIFNTSFISAHLAEMNYDANKLPLGKLAKNTILAGFAVLKVSIASLSMRPFFRFVPLIYTRRHAAPVLHILTFLCRLLRT